MVNSVYVELLKIKDVWESVNVLSILDCLLFQLRDFPLDRDYYFSFSVQLEMF